MDISTSDARQAIPSTCWPDIVRRAEHEGLRAIARDYGVSHTAIRSALVTAGHAHLLSNQERRRRLVTSGPLPPPAPCKVERTRYAEVVELCQHHTQAEVAELLGVSQTTIWRVMQRMGKGPCPVPLHQSSRHEPSHPSHLSQPTHQADPRLGMP